MDSFQLSCPAKINLFLEVLDKRPDGYHNLYTLFQKVAWSDQLGAIYHPEFSLESNLSCTENPQDNLVLKAAHAFARHFPCSQALKFQLTKNIPTGAGLGGGSSDAAGALLLCKKALYPAAPLEKLREIATTLGADVPFFLSPSKIAVGEGIGEKLKGVPALPNLYVLIATPQEFVPTAEAYRNLNPHRTATWEKAQPIWESSERGPEIYKLMKNDFEDSVFQKYPNIQSLKQELQGFHPLASLLSGSGASVFALFSHKSLAETALLQVEKKCRFSTVTQFL